MSRAETFASTAVLLAMVMIVGCGRTPKVQIDFDDHTAFSTLHTYAWEESTRLANADLDKLFVERVDAELAASGLEQVEKDSDIVVEYHGSTERDREVNSNSWQGKHASMGGPGGFPDREIKRGTLTVSLWDSASKKKIWTASATHKIGADFDWEPRHIDSAVDQMFRSFPPNDPRKPKTVTP